MDHLPQLRDSKRFRADLSVPFLNEPRWIYDGKGLQDFPARCKFDFQKPIDSKMAWDWDISAFFQSWLFFGTLTEVFQVYNIEIVREDFKSPGEDGRDCLSTRMLQDYIAAWIVQASREYPGCLDKNEYYSKARKYSETVGSVAGNAVGSSIHAVRNIAWRRQSDSERPRSAYHLWNEVDKARMSARRINQVLEIAATKLHDLRWCARVIHSAVWDSILILCTTLRSASFFLYRSCLPDSSPTTLFNTLKARLIPNLLSRNEWCKREQRIMRALVDGDQCAILLYAQLDRRQSHLSHLGCSENECKAYQVNEQDYQTRHKLDCDGCNFTGFDGFDSAAPAQHKLIQIYTTDKSRSANLIPMATFSDGKLQLVPLLMSQWLGRKFVAISHVWADKLGNPDKNALPLCQLAYIQDRVNELFPEQKECIPFWMDTLCIPVDKDRTEEFKNARKKAITLMEGVYKSATKILVLDRTLTTVTSAEMAPEEVGLRIMCSGWARRLWTLQEGLFQAQTYYQFQDMTYTYAELEKKVRSTHAFPLRKRVIPEHHSLHVILDSPPNCATSIEPLACFAYKPLSCCWPRIASFFKELNIRYSQPDPAWFPGMQLVPCMIVLVPRALRTIAYRTTSRSEDEGIILTSLTNWRAGSVGSVVEADKENRLRVCFERFDIVPSELIFLDQKRYDDLGKRWIPQSLLAQSSKGTNRLPFEHRIISDEFSWPSPRGITADYTSYLLSFPSGLNPLVGGPNFLLILSGSEYIGSIHDAGSNKSPTSLPPNLALILPRSFQPGSWRGSGVLVSIQSESSIAPGKGCSLRSVSGVLARARGIVAMYNDKKRILGRHEALVDLIAIKDGEELSEILPQAEGTIISQCTTKNGFTRWRIG